MREFCLRFVLYQLSKNLNRPFFMEFLTKLSVDYDKECHDDEPLLGGTVLVESKFQVHIHLEMAFNVVHINFV